MRSIGYLLAVAVGSLALVAAPRTHAEETPRNYFKVAVAYTAMNNSSGELTGPPGTTPPGIEGEADDVTTLGLIYGRRLTGDWTLELAGGLPPEVKVNGAGAAEGLGEVGTAKAWYPALVLSYSFSNLSPHFKPYIGGGVNYTWFTDEKISAGYNSAVGGTSTSGSLDSSVGPVAKAGAEINIGGSWFVDVNVQRYWIDTTATIVTEAPGFGKITRKIDLAVDPNLYAVAIAYHF